MFFLELTGLDGKPIVLNMSRVEIIQPFPDGGTQLFFTGENACTRVTEEMDEIRTRFPRDYWFARARSR